MKLSQSTIRISCLILGGAFAMGLASCGGKADLNAKTSTGSGGSSAGLGGAGEQGKDNDGSGSGGARNQGSGGASGGGTGGVSSGGGGTGGVPSGGGMSTGGNDGSGGASAPNPGVQILGKTCGSPGSLACAGENQKLQLLCDATGAWVQNGTCSGTEVCDTGAASRGSCQEPIAACADKAPGELICGAADAVHSCGPDRLSSEEVEKCEGRCNEAVCTTDAVCPANDVHLVDCNGDCAAKSTDCKISPITNCEYIIVPREQAFPVSARLPAADEICHSDPEDTCDRNFFVVRFFDTEESYRVTLPPGAHGSIFLESNENGEVVVDQSIDAACSVLDQDLTSDCVTVPARSYWKVLENNTDFHPNKGIMIYLSDGASAQNVQIEAGECP